MDDRAARLVSTVVVFSIAPLVQDVFDIAVLSLNDYQPIPTTTDGTPPRTMAEMLDAFAATLRGAQGREPPSGRR